MADDFDIDAALEELEEEEKGQHGDLIEEVEERADAEDGKAKKKTRLEERIDSLEAKFQQDALQRAIKQFTEKADDIERDLFDAARKDEPIKSIEDFEKAAEVAKQRAAAIREREAELMKQAEERAAKAWGTGPVGSNAAPADAEKELMERISKGDMHAAFEAIVTPPPV